MDKQTTSHLPRPPGGIQRLTLVVVALVAGALTLASCGNGDDPSNSSDSAVHDEASVSSPAEIFSSNLNYVEVSSPSRLLKLADEDFVVIVGRVEGFHRGQTYAADYPPGLKTSVMAVQVGKVLRGSLPPDDAERVHVEFDFPPDRVPRGFLRGESTLIYLSPLSNNSSIKSDVPIEDRGAGLPEGSTLFTTHPQGFVIETPEGVVQPMHGVEFPEARLEQFTPDRGSFPPGQRASGSGGF